MERLLSRSTTPTDKPEWLVKLQHATNQAFSSRGIEDTPEEWQQLKDFVDWFISKLYMRRDIKIRSNISTRIVKKDGQSYTLSEMERQFKYFTFKNNRRL